ncbi:MAG: META domain-containing protein [Treponema sp.]|nr:META domain-containing protein [Treponema sp.]
MTIAGVTFSCASTPQFSNVKDKNWELVELRNKSETIVFDRNKLSEDGFEKVFTLRFDEERIHGVGAPNQYSAPYTVTDKQAITIKPMISTLMAPLRELEELKEHEYYIYLQSAAKWNLEKGNLELYTKGEGGAEVVLIFAPKN